MPRGPRFELAGAVHHVTARTTSGRVLFVDDADRHRYLRLLAREVRAREWSLMTFCLMTNHVHLLVQTPEPDLGLGIKRMHEDYGRYVNKRHNLWGHLFGSRFDNRFVRTDRHLIGCLRYIARNPVRHGACAQPQDWPWGAHNALAGLADVPAFLDAATAYRHLAPAPDAGRRAYVRLVAQSDQALMHDLVGARSDQWLVAAVDDYRVPITEVATFLNVGRSTAYERVATARRTVGSVPSVRRIVGSVPSVRWAVSAEG